MNKALFEEMMEQIDKKLREKGTQIHGRPLGAMCEVSERLKIKVFLGPRSLGAIEGVYNELTFAAHINKWYTARYGDRLKLHLGPGSVAMLIRGDPWLLKLPRIYGTIKVTCDPDMRKYVNGPSVWSGDDPPIWNVLNSIKDFPAGLAADLTLGERKQILAFFLKCLDILEKLEKVLNQPYVKEAKADLESSVSNIFANPPQYGLSKWSSLQFTEKLIKSFLGLKKARIPRHHDLAKVAQEAQNLGLCPLNPLLLGKVQCNAGVRYGDISVTLEEAIAAHHAALLLSQQLAKEIKKA